MSEQNYNLRPLWDAILDLYLRFDAFCKCNDLRYYATGGTLLGAVRHNGFIPWDDDFDVVMPRPDYARFISLQSRDERIANARVDSVELNPAWSLLFAKVSESREDVVSRVSRESNLDLRDGVCIDVIPIDGMPKSTIPFYYWALKRTAWRHAGERPLKWRLLSWVFECKPDPIAFQNWLASYDYDHSPCVEDYNANGRRFRLRALSASSFGAPVMHKFDFVEIPLPVEYDVFLRGIFGDYMRLPSVDKRRPQHQISVK